MISQDQVLTKRLCTLLLAYSLEGGETTYNDTMSKANKSEFSKSEVIAIGQWIAPIMAATPPFEAFKRLVPDRTSETKRRAPCPQLIITITGFCWPCFARLTWFTEAVLLLRALWLWILNQVWSCQNRMIVFRATVLAANATKVCTFKSQSGWNARKLSLANPTGQSDWSLYAMNVAILLDSHSRFKIVRSANSIRIN